MIIFRHISIALIVAVLLHPVPLLAQQDIQADKADSGKSITKGIKGLLWEVSGKNLNQPSYIFGTMHQLCEEDALLSDSLQFAIDAATRVYLELDAGNFSEKISIITHVRMRGNKRLRDLLTSEEYKRVKNYFKNNPVQLRLSFMARFKPLFITYMIEDSRLPCNRKKGMEEMIMKAAKKRGKKIYGLETVAFQAGLVDSIPYIDQAKDLLKRIDSAARGDSITDRVVATYRSQDLDAIEKMMGTDTAILKFFLWDRNVDWVFKMEKLMPGGSVLFAVGAAHLAGEKGVLQLLQNSGYTIKTCYAYSR